MGNTSALLETITSNFLLLNSYQKPESKKVSKEDLPADRKNMQYINLNFLLNQFRPSKANIFTASVT